MSDLEIAAYEKLFDSKHHYDNLSWIIGAPVLAVVGGLLAYMPTMHDADRPTQIGERVVIMLFIWLVLFGWRSIYQRNRMWAEAANEAIRDIERAHKLKGAGIAFMRLALERKVVLKNTDENGVLIDDPFTEIMREKSIHGIIPKLAVLIGALAVVACIVP